MSHIDERIVKMTFDNSNFEGKISQTLQSLEKLNQVLNNTGNAQAVNQLSKSMKDIQSQLSTLKFDELDKLTEKTSIWQKLGNGLSTVGKSISGVFSKLNIGGTIDKLHSSFSKATEGSSGLGKSVESVSSKFSALGVMGVTALANITNKAVNAGTSLVKSLTLDPITTGFSEYETKMGAIQTILTNTAHHGTTLDDVNNSLGDLNTYADKTIYNFAQMTDNIGKFTAAGIDLDTSTMAIKGIANLAAASGSTSAQASTAMYQLSQALAAGKVSLMDWNSVVNAGMGGKLFQDALIRTSEQMGTGAEAMIEKYGSFRESLTQGEWLTTDVLTETLKQISGAYTEADLIAQGYTKSQAQEIVKLAENATKAATEVKTVTQLMDTMKESVQSGWATSWEHIIGDKDQSTKLLTSISEGFNSIIEPSTKARNEMLKFWNENGGRDDVISGLGNVFTSLGKGLGSVGEAWREVFPAMTGEKLVDISGKFKDFTEKIKMNDETAGKIKNTFKGVFDVFDTVKDAVVNIGKGFLPLTNVFGALGNIFLSATSGIGSFVSQISDAIEKSKVFSTIGDMMGKGITGLGNILTTAGSGITKFFDYLGNLDFSKAFNFLGKGFGAIGDTLKPVFDGVGDALGSINFDTIMKAVQTGTFLKVLGIVKDTFTEVSSVGDSLKGVFNSFKGIGANIKSVLSNVKNVLVAFQQELQAKTLLKIAAAIGILAGSLLLLASIDAGKLAVGLGGLAGVFAELALAYIAIGKFGGGGGFGVSAKLISMASAILILSGALKILSTINIGEMVTGLVGMAAMFAAMTAAVKIFSTSSKGLKQTSAGLILFAAAMAAMGGALKVLGSIDANTLGAGLFTLAGVMAELAIFMKVTDFSNLGTKSGAGILLMASAILVLSQAVKQFASLNPAEIITGLVGIAGVLAEIAVFAKFGGSGMNMLTLAVGLTAMSAAITVMSIAMRAMGTIQWDELARGLVGIAGALTILGVAGATMNGLQLTVAAVGVTAMSAALLILSGVLHTLGGLSWSELAVGLTALAGSLTILAVAMYAMAGGLAGAAAMVVMAGALALFVPQMILLSQLSLAQVGVGLVALAGAFTVLGVAGLLLSPIVPVLIALGAAVALLGVGCAAAGAGITLMGTGLAAVAAAVGASGMIIIEFVRQLINLLPQLGQKAGEAMVQFANAIATGAPTIINAFTQIMTELLNSVTQLAPQIAQTGMTLVTEFAAAIASGVPQLVDSGMKLITGILEGIAANIGNVVNAASNVIVNFINGISANLGSIINAGINLALSFIEGVASGISSNQGRLQSAIRSVIQAMIQAGIAVITGGIQGFVSGGKQLMTGLVNGIKSMMSAAGSAVKSCVNAAKTAASNLGSALVSAGKSLIQGLVNGITSMAKSVASKARDVVQGAIDAAKNALKINSPSKVFISIGKSVDEGFIDGLGAWSNKVNNAATEVANGVINNVANPLSNIGKIIEGDVDMNPVITPVLDLTKVQNGARTIGSLMNADMIGVNPRTGAIARSIGTIQNGKDNSDILSALKDLNNTVANNSGGTTNYINGITYDDGSNIKDAVETLIRAATIERRI